jgi:hypothetical protein
MDAIFSYGENNLERIWPELEPTHETAKLLTLLMSSLQEEHSLSSLIFLRRLFWWDKAG